MTFTSLTWFAVMVGTIGFYWLLPSSLRKIFLALASLVFFVLIDWVSACYLIIFLFVSYAVTHYCPKSKLAISITIASIIGVLAYHKLQISSQPFDVLRDVAMPIGMSYYIFRIIHYMIDKYRNILPDHTFYEYTSYLFFLPTLLVGPIHRFTQFHSDYHLIQWRALDLSEGIERILIGYFKIIVIGNFLLSKYLATYIGNIDPSYQSLMLYLEAVRGSFNLYILFSGYSDIALGFALTLGYRVMENFDSPFLKTNIADFWRAWHISLTSWSRDYIYMTTIGLTRNPYFATLVSLTAIGIWHEISLRYVVWGMYHGLGIIFVNKLQKYMRQKNKSKKLKNKIKETNKFINAIKIFLTANYFFFGYIIINQESLSDSITVIYLILFGWLN